MNVKAQLFGCHKGQAWTKWGHFDFSKPWHCIRWNFFRNVDWLFDRPRACRFFWANNFSHWAHRLRGGQSYDLGYGARGNRASFIEDSLRFRFVPPPAGMNADEANEALSEIEELAQLARATTWIEE